MNVAVERSNKQDRFDGNILRLLPACLNQKYKTASGTANFKIFEFHFLKQVYFQLWCPPKI
ncbi:hypothetical protein D0A37_03505 [Microcoleus vaginatus HSN003]|nr:hypothetical protein D0A37_03505 [Microcoleus vaginatus HSN003]